MCPSYMVTLDERHSTRGRAHLLFEMMRGDVITDGWRSDASANRSISASACKACKTECPTHVDMASYKAEFMAHYSAGRLRSREAYVFGWLHRWLALGRPFAPLANFATHAPGLRVLAKRVAGIAPERDIRGSPRDRFAETFALRPRGRAPRASSCGPIPSTMRFIPRCWTTPSVCSALRGSR